MNFKEKTSNIYERTLKVGYADVIFINLNQKTEKISFKYAIFDK